MLEDGYISYWCWLLQTGIQPVLQPAPDPPWTLPTLTGVSTCWCYWHGENSRSEERDFFGSFHKRKVDQKIQKDAINHQLQNDIIHYHSANQEPRNHSNMCIDVCYFYPKNNHKNVSPLYSRSLNVKFQFRKAPKKAFTTLKIANRLAQEKIFHLNHVEKLPITTTQHL